MSSDALQAQMAQGKESVISVLAIHVIIRPLSMKRPLVGPERVDEVEASVPKVFERNLHAGQGV